MQVLLDKAASKYLARLGEPMKGRIKKAIAGLGDTPPSGDIKHLIGRDGYRLRVGGYRVLFDRTDSAIIVYKIGPRGQVYKED